MSQTARTEYVRYTEYPDSIWVAKYVTDKGRRTQQVITEEIAREIVKDRRARQQGKLVRMLLHADIKINMTWDAKIYLSGTEGMDGVAAAAIVYDENEWEVMANFAPWIKRFPIKTKTFIDDIAARDWLIAQPLVPPALPDPSQAKGRLEETWKRIMQSLGYMTDDRDRTFLEVALKTIDLPLLTKAELEVLSDLDRGFSAGDISVRRHTATKTVNAQLQTIYHKLNTHTRGMALAKARLLGIIPL